MHCYCQIWKGHTLLSSVRASPGDTGADDDPQPRLEARRARTVRRRHARRLLRPRLETTYRRPSTDDGPPSRLDVTANQTAATTLRPGATSVSRRHAGGHDHTDNNGETALKPLNSDAVTARRTVGSVPTTNQLWSPRPRVLGLEDPRGHILKPLALVLGASPWPWPLPTRSCPGSRLGLRVLYYFFQL